MHLADVGRVLDILGRQRCHGDGRRCPGHNGRRRDGHAEMGRQRGGNQRGQLAGDGPRPRVRGGHVPASGRVELQRKRVGSLVGRLERIVRRELGQRVSRGEVNRAGIVRHPVAEGVHRRHRDCPGRADAHRGHGARDRQHVRQRGRHGDGGGGPLDRRLADFGDGHRQFAGGFQCHREGLRPVIAGREGVIGRQNGVLVRADEMHGADVVRVHGVLGRQRVHGDDHRASGVNAGHPRHGHAEMGGRGRGRRNGDRVGNRRQEVRRAEGAEGEAGSGFAQRQVAEGDDAANGIRRECPAEHGPRRTGCEGDIDRPVERVVNGSERILQRQRDAECPPRKHRGGDGREGKAVAGGLDERVCPKGQGASLERKIRLPDAVERQTGEGGDAVDGRHGEVAAQRDAPHGMVRADGDRADERRVRVAEIVLGGYGQAESRVGDHFVR